MEKREDSSDSVKNLTFYSWFKNAYKEYKDEEVDFNDALPELLSELISSIDDGNIYIPYDIQTDVYNLINDDKIDDNDIDYLIVSFDEFVKKNLPVNDDNEETLVFFPRLQEILFIVKAELSRVRYAQTFTFEPKSYNPEDQELSEKLEKLEKEFKTFQPQASELIENIDKDFESHAIKISKDIDSDVSRKLERNTLSTISALTIFSAIIIAFTGGFHYLSDVLVAASIATPTRLVFMSALIGFVLINTIFLLVYFVSKIVNKPIANHCPYQNDNNVYPKCGQAHCSKAWNIPDSLCIAFHKYNWMLAINSVLILLMYSSAVNYYTNYNSNININIFDNMNLKTEIFIVGLILPVVIFLIIIIVRSIYKNIIVKRHKLACVVELLEDNIPVKITSNIWGSTVAKIYTAFANRNVNIYDNEIDENTYNNLQAAANSVGSNKKTENSSALNKEQIKNIRNTSLDILGENNYDYLSNVVKYSLRQHRYNKKRFKILAEKLKI